MLPDPLHPAIVHLPIALALLSPALALLAWLAIRAGFVPPRTWAIVVLLQVLLVGSSWLAIETGEDQEEKVEDIVGERHMESHEEAAERFLYVAIAAAVVSAGGLFAGSRGGFARVATVAAGAAVLAAGIAVGHSGGELVYRHGAASAYVERGAGDAPESASLRRERDEDD